jgi:alpha-L-arabinofuranosidase
MKRSIAIEPRLVVSHRINPYQYGQFIEYLYDVVTGMWGEKLHDQSFEGQAPYNVGFRTQIDNREKPWYPIGQVARARYARDDTEKVNGRVSQRITSTGDPASLGIAQDGIFAKRGATDTVSVYLRSDTPGLPVMARVRDAAGRVLAEAALRSTAAWKKHSAKLRYAGTTENGTFSFELRGPGTLWIDQASLMPEDTINGWRPEAVEAIRALKSGIIRFGGSTIENYEWRDLVGPADERPPWLNEPWGGIHPTGAGLENVIDLIRRAGADVLWCIRVTNRAPEEAAAQVEYFNGSVETEMGALRAKNGHRKPYGIRYWQVGNEVGGDEYARDLAACCVAMKKADPSIRIMSSYPNEAVLRLAGRHLDYISPHHYSPDIAGCEANLADLRRMIDEHSPKKDIGIAVTEWNTTGADWGLARGMLWTLDNALACSRYHAMIHRHAGFVEIANRSNMCNSLCSGILQTDNHRLFKTPTWYAQALFANHAGVWPVEVKLGGGFDRYDVSATLSERGDRLTLFITNRSLATETCIFDLAALGAGAQTAKVWTVEDTRHAGERDAANSFWEPKRIRTVPGTARIDGPVFPFDLPALSLTVMELRVKARGLLPAQGHNTNR